MTDQPAGEPEPAASVVPAAAEARRDRVTVRRSPRYGRFIILGAGLGAVVTFVLTNLFPTDEAVGFGALFGYFLLFGIPAGAAIGGLVAVVLERVVSGRSAQLEFERERVEEADVERERGGTEEADVDPNAVDPHAVDVDAAGSNVGGPDTVGPNAVIEPDTDAATVADGPGAEGPTRRPATSGD